MQINTPNLSFTSIYRFNRALINQHKVRQIRTDIANNNGYRSELTEDEFIIHVPDNRDEYVDAYLKEERIRPDAYRKEPNPVKIRKQAG